MSEGDKEFAGGFVPVMKSSGDLTLREVGAIALVAAGNSEITDGGAAFCVVGGDVSIEQGGAGTMIVGGGVQLNDGAVGQMATVEANVADSRVGLLVAAKAKAATVVLIVFFIVSLLRKTVCMFAIVRKVRRETALGSLDHEHVINLI